MEQTRPKPFSALLAHPLTLTFIGFLLTGVLGTLLVKFFDNLSKEREIEQTRHTRAVDAVIELSTLINDRRTRAVLVASAIVRRASSKEIEARKLAYDEAYVRWNSCSCPRITGQGVVARGGPR